MLVNVINANSTYTTAVSPSERRGLISNVDMGRVARFFICLANARTMGTLWIYGVHAYPFEGVGLIFFRTAAVLEPDYSTTHP